MNKEKWIETYREDDSKIWEYSEFIKHNPVLYPRVGDVFLKELFLLANPDYEMPYSRRKKVQMDSVWYGVSEETLALYVKGCELTEGKTANFAITLDNEHTIPFTVCLYLMCLFVDKAKQMSSRQVSVESIGRLKKDKAQKGICKPDCRKYYRCIGYTPDQIASDMPVTKNFCPVEKEYSCERKCPTGITIGKTRIEKGMFTFREKEELLYLYLLKTGRLPVGVLAGELLFDFLVKEYAAYCDLLEEQNGVDAMKTSVNCQLFNVFAYLVDGLCAADWLEIKEVDDIERLKEDLEKNRLWQLLERLNSKRQECRQENMFAEILYNARKALAERKKDLTITPINP